VEIMETRRAFLRTSLTVPAALALMATAETRGQAQTLSPTPACGDEGDLTPLQTEGPFFKPRSPQRTSLLEPGLTGPKIVVRGVVLSTACKPIARALIDVWHADDHGDYDNDGYRLRGHQFTDDAGRYTLETIVPGLYPGRTRHFHVKVQAPNQPVLTTQLYFPDEPGNTRDVIFNRALVLKVESTNDGKVGTFNFVVDDQLKGNRARPRR
jgi:protocatechuate 3,4-dioxygenase beta subunit